MARQVYPEDYSCIFDPVNGKGGLYIGNLEAAENLPNLRRLQIKAVLTAAKGVELGHPKSDVPYTLYVPANDHESCDISKYFHQAANFINDCLERTNIMVHCLAGVSRSVSLVISYLIKHRGFSFQKAYETIKSRRRIIHPNDGFIQHLKRFQREQNVQDTRSMSSSPTKKNIYKDSSLSSSPTKKYAPSPQIEAIISKYQNYKNQAFASINKNPQATLELRKIQSYKERPSSQLGQYRVKRTSSMNVEKNDSYESRQEFGTYSRRISQYNPLESIQNKPSTSTSSATSDIDRKIQEIRRKYQEYQTPSQPSSYSRFSSMNYDENSSRPGSFGLDKDYGKYGREAYCGEITKNRLKRLTSFQDY